MLSKRCALCNPLLGFCGGGRRAVEQGCSRGLICHPCALDEPLSTTVLMPHRFPHRSDVAVVRTSQRALSRLHQSSGRPYLTPQFGASFCVRSTSWALATALMGGLFSTLSQARVPCACAAVVPCARAPIRPAQAHTSCEHGIMSNCQRVRACVHPCSTAGDGNCCSHIRSSSHLARSLMTAPPSPPSAPHRGARLSLGAAGRATRRHPLPSLASTSVCALLSQAQNPGT